MNCVCLACRSSRGWSPRRRTARRASIFTPGGHRGRIFYRSRNWDRYRGDLHHRQPRPHLPGVTLGAKSFSTGRGWQPGSGDRPASDRRGRCDHLLRRDDPRPGDDRPRLGDRRQCLARPQRAAGGAGSPRPRAAEDEFERGSGDLISRRRSPPIPCAPHHPQHA